MHGEGALACCVIVKRNKNAEVTFLFQFVVKYCGDQLVVCHHCCDSCFGLGGFMMKRNLNIPSSSCPPKKKG